MKRLQYIGTFDIGILIDQLLVAFPSWRYINPPVVIDSFGYSYDDINGILTLDVPDDADEVLIGQVVDAHDPSARIYTHLNWEDIVRARLAFMQMPSWASWTPVEASDFVSNDILAGMTKLEIEAWVDTNVTNLTTAKTALSLIGGELVDLREICMRMAYAIMLLRDVAIRRRE